MATSQQTDNNKPSTTTTPASKLAELTLDYGNMKIEEVYAMAREFAKAKEGSKAIVLSYNDRNMLNVLTKQVHYSKYSADKCKVGFLDLVGQDRVALWKSLGEMPKEEAMRRYIELLAKVCPLFTAHLEAHKRHLEELEEKRKKKLEEEEELKRKAIMEQKEKKLKEEDLKLLEENKKRREEMQRKQIQEALNQQTYPHFKAYAEQQHPNNVQAQEELIKQLQEQHFEQYMNQVYQQQLLHQQQQAEQLRAMRRAQKKQEQSVDDKLKQLSLNSSSSNGTNSTLVALNASTTSSLTASASLATTNSSVVSETNSINSGVLSPDSLGFTLVSENESTTKTSSKKLGGAGGVSKTENETLVNGGAGAFTNGSSVAADSSSALDSSALVLAKPAGTDADAEDEDDDEDDIELPPISAASMLTRKDIKEFKESVRRDNDAIIKVGSGETVTVRVPTHEDGRLIFWEFATDYYDLGFGLYFEWTISPSNNVTVHVSDSSEDEEGEEEDPANPKQDIEKGDAKAAADSNKPPCDEIIPIFRRECHEEVYAGSHLYPGRGVYLLKFDNSYSLWRSKTLYYRVYYSK